MRRRLVGRSLLVAGAALLFGTAGLHAMGTQMISEWSAALEERQQAALRLVWLTDSISWAVAAVMWLIAASRPNPSWRAAAAVVALIPLLAAVGIIRIDPSFFGSYLLLASAGMALAGSALAVAASANAEVPRG